VVIGKVGGDLKLEKFGGASIESVGGDCVIKQAEGAIEITRIGDSLHGDGVIALLAGSVGGDVRLVNVTGKIEVTAGDEVTIRSSLTDLPEIRVNAGSDIHLIVPKDAKGLLDLHSGSEDIKIHAGGQDAELEDSDAELPMGEGGALISLTAGDSIIVNDEVDSDWDFEDESDDLEDHWRNFGIEIEKRVKESLKQAADTMERASHHIEYTGKNVQRKVEQTLRNLDEKGIITGRPRKVVGFTIGEPGVAPAPLKAGPSDEERMLVLRMLQEKKISVEEAEKLLNALDR
jgi:hypothetical protein